jgi:hypothetical protein
MTIIVKPLRIKGDRSHLSRQFLALLSTKTNTQHLQKNETFLFLGTKNIKD